ncbi:hypothetical protein KGQ20_43015 [Catenulispora sp. NF23]|uniref:hypothetical protein n=1 Tax=Catenulispora pinistramenti TaxID=2705254 RepID=UPI001BA58E8B|nr:hypothetical protein [Catenulispora pinistramenti]MBS2539534.1 hypothetical protein [Catenulispora pinistramenti]
MASEIIVVRGAGGWRDRAKGYDVVVDGVVRGEVRAGQTLSIPVASGPHTIRMEVSWTSSATLTAVVGDGPVVFGCSSGRTDPLTAVEEHPDSYVDIWRAASVEEVQAGGPIPLVSTRRRAGSLPVLALVWLLGLILFGVGLLAGGGGWQTVVKTAGLAMFVFASWTVAGYRGWLKRRGR